MLRQAMLRQALLGLLSFTASSKEINPRLYNLSEDPYESVNYITDGSYSDILNTLMLRLDYFNSVSQSTDYAMSLQYITHNAFKKSGGVVPLDYASPPQLPISNVSAAAATAVPSILFVLFDDVGVNDLSFDNALSSWLPDTPNIRGLAASGIRLTHHCNKQFCLPQQLR